MPSAIQNYLSNIRSRITNNLRIRIGGNGMDSSTYVPSQTQMIVLTDPNAYFNDIPVDFGPVFFDVLNAMADTVGEMQFIIGLSMQNPSQDSNVIELATAAEQMLGRRLDAMLLGNVSRTTSVTILSPFLSPFCRNRTCMLATEHGTPTICPLMYALDEH